MLFWVVVIAAFILYRMNRKLVAVEQVAAELRGTVERLSRQVAELSRRTAPGAPPRAALDVEQPATRPAAPLPPPLPQPLADRAAAQVPAPVEPVVVPRSEPDAGTAVPPAPPPPATPPTAMPPRPTAPARRPKLVPELVPATLRAKIRDVLDPPRGAAAGTAGATGSASGGPGSSPPPPPSGPPPAPPEPPTAGRPSFDWEGLIGVKLFSWIAGLALALAGVFFLRYSVEHGFLEPPVRMAIGIVVGVGLLVGCELKAARRYPQTANALDGAGIAILFSTFFAAHALWHLIPALGAFALLATVTAVAVLLSIRRQSIFIALLGLLGGFATPALLASGQNNPIGLFGYLLVLNAGLAWVAYRRRWPLLTALSFVFTTFYQWGWVVKFLTAGSVPLAVGIFLVFPLLAFVSLALGGRRAAGDDWSPLFGQTARASAAFPLLFAVYLAVVPAYGARYGILFGFLFLVDAGLFAIAAARGPRRLHLLGALATVLVFAVWLNGSYSSDAWPVVLAFVALFVLFYLGAPLALELPAVARRVQGRLTGQSARAVFAAPLLLFVFPALVALEPRTAGPGLAFAVLFVLVAANAAYAIVRREGAVHFLAAFFALVAETVWSVKYLNERTLLPGLALYGAFGLLYIGVPALARRLGRPLRPQRAGAVLILASIALLFLLTAGAVANVALWGLALLLALLNVGLFWEAGSERLPLLSIIGVALSWLVLAAWWMTAAVAALVLPALIVVAGFSLLALGGSIWAKRAAAGDDASAEGSDAGVFLGLVGHLFLLFVAARPTLSVPPWPMLGVLGVLNLAVATAALYARSGRLHLGAAAAAPLVLTVWEMTAEVAPWPAVAVLAAGALAALAFAWIPLARRTRNDDPMFEGVAAAATLLAQVVAVVASAQPGTPSLGFLLAAQLVFVVALLALAALPQWRALAVAAVLPAAAAGFVWQAQHAEPTAWAQQLLFTAPIYLTLAAYPVVLGRRAGKAVEPYLAAVLASAAFFFQARHSIALGGHANVIGLLPVVQAAIVAALLRQLLRIEPPGARTLGRLALVAGVALAFVTVAIPLQLEKNWITIGWAVEGAALAWLYRRIPHRGLLLAATGLLAVVFVRLAVNPAVLTYEPRGAMRIWNWYLYTYLLCAGAMLLAGWLLSKTDDVLVPKTPRVSSLLPAGGAVLLFLLLNIEIADFFATGPTITFNFTATIAQDLTYTLGWAVFAVGLLAAGIALRVRPARIAAIGLLAVAVMKAFLHDLGRLGGLYRVSSFVGLAICLSLVAVALQKFVLTPKETR